MYEAELDVVALAQLARDPVGDGDRAVPAAGAADGDREVLLALGDVSEQQALLADPVDDAAAARQRMAAAGLLVAVEQGVLVGLEEDHLEVEAAIRQLAEHRLQVVEVLPASHVGDHRGLLYPAPLVPEQ